LDGGGDSQSRIDLRVASRLCHQLGGFGLNESSGGLILSRLGEVCIAGDQLIGLSATGSHLIQLIGHDVQLSLENQILENAHDNNSHGQEGDSNTSSSGSARGAILGVFFLFLGAIVLKIALYIFDATVIPLGLRFAWWVIGGIAALLIFQGTILIFDRELSAPDDAGSLGAERQSSVSA
jgi:hypothetical protein